MFDIDELLNVLVIVYTVMEMEIFYFVYAYNLYNINNSYYKKLKN